MEGGIYGLMVLWDLEPKEVMTPTESGPIQK